MRIHTRIEMVWCDERKEYVQITEEGYDLPDDASVAYCKGASDQQTDLAKSQQDFYDTLSKNYNTQFANQSNILNTLNSSLTPIVNAGAGQYGYSNAQDAALRTQASAGTSTAFRNAKQSLGQDQAAQGGGDQFLPSGVKTQQQSQLATAAANQESSQQLGITNQGYEVGRQNFNNAVSAENGVAAQYNPNGYASSADSAGSTAYNSADENTKLNNAASPWGIVGGVLGGALSAGVSGFTGGVGTALGKKF